MFHELIFITCGIYSLCTINLQLLIQLVHFLIEQCLAICIKWTHLKKAKEKPELWEQYN